LPSTRVDFEAYEDDEPVLWGHGTARPPVSHRQNHPEASDIISLVLEPADDFPLPEILPRQYVSMFVNLRDGDRQPRQYTVSSTAVGTRLQITVRRVRGRNGAPHGRVSTYLHDKSEGGRHLDVSASAGDFVLTPSDSPLLLASAGARHHDLLPIASTVCGHSHGDK
jgi:nitric oxide dioxygenase